MDKNFYESLHIGQTILNEMKDRQMVSPFIYEGLKDVSDEVRGILEENLSSVGLDGDRFEFTFRGTGKSIIISLKDWDAAYKDPTIRNVRQWAGRFGFPDYPKDNALRQAINRMFTAINKEFGTNYPHTGAEGYWQKRDEIIKGTTADEYREKARGFSGQGEKVEQRVDIGNRNRKINQIEAINSEDLLPGTFYTDLTKIPRSNHAKFWKFWDKEIASLPADRKSFFGRKWEKSFIFGYQVYDFLFYEVWYNSIDGTFSLYDMKAVDITGERYETLQAATRALFNAITTASKSDADYARQSPTAQSMFRAVASDLDPMIQRFQQMEKKDQSQFQKALEDAMKGWTSFEKDTFMNEYNNTRFSNETILDAARRYSVAFEKLDGVNNDKLRNAAFHDTLERFEKAVEKEVNPPSDTGFTVGSTTVYRDREREPEADRKAERQRGSGPEGTVGHPYHKPDGPAKVSEEEMKSITTVFGVSAKKLFTALKNVAKTSTDKALKTRIELAMDAERFDFTSLPDLIEQIKNSNHRKSMEEIEKLIPEFWEIWDKQSKDGSTSVARRLLDTVHPPKTLTGGMDLADLVYEVVPEDVLKSSPSIKKAAEGAKSQFRGPRSGETYAVTLANLARKVLDNYNIPKEDDLFKQIDALEQKEANNRRPIAERAKNFELNYARNLNHVLNQAALKKSKDDLDALTAATRKAFGDGSNLHYKSGNVVQTSFKKKEQEPEPDFKHAASTTAPPKDPLKPVKESEEFSLFSDLRKESLKIINERFNDPAIRETREEIQKNHSNVFLRSMQKEAEQMTNNQKAIRTAVTENLIKLYNRTKANKSQLNTWWERLLRIDSDIQSPIDVRGKGVDYDASFVVGYTLKNAVNLEIWYVTEKNPSGPRFGRNKTMSTFYVFDVTSMRIVRKHIPYLRHAVDEVVKKIGLVDRNI